MSIEYPTLSNGRYQIEQCIGMGGMAAVFKSFDNTLKMPRAIKVLKPEMITRSGVRERFSVEAIAMASLQHPNIVTVYDHGEEGLTLFIVMEYLPYNSLQHYLDSNGPLSREQALRISLDVSQAVAHAHKNGVIHRDIKPDNILLSPERAKLSDFGLARIDSTQSRNTQTKAVMGTFPYMAPEQRLSAKKTTHQADIYAITASLFVMLTGKDPSDLFDEEERALLLRTVDDDLANIIAKGCQARLDERYAEASELVTDLEELYVNVDKARSHLHLSSVEEIPPVELSELLTVWSHYTGAAEAGNQGNPGASETLMFEIDEDDPFTDTADIHSVKSVPEVSPPEMPRSAAEVQPIPEQSESNRLLLIFASIFVLIAGASVGMYSAAFLSEVKEDNASQQQEKVSIEEIRPPDWNYTSIVVLQNPKEEKEQQDLIEVRRAMLNGEYSRSESLLYPLLKKYPAESGLHFMAAMIQFLRGYEVLSVESSRKAASHSRNIEGDLPVLIQLFDQSWRDQENATALLSKWDALRSQNQDPLIEISYLIAARFILGPEELLKAVRETRAQHDDWIVLLAIELYALEQLRQDEEMLTIVDQGLSLFPASTELLVVRGRIQYRLGKQKGAEVTLKEAQKKDTSLIAATSLLSTLYIEQNKETDRISQMIISTGESISSFDSSRFLREQGRQLANHGQVREADKIWDFCTRETITSGHRDGALNCTSTALLSYHWLQPTSSWSSWLDKLGELLEYPGFDASVRQFHTLLIQWGRTVSEIRQGRVEQGEALIEQLQKMNPSDLPLAHHQYLLLELKKEVYLAKKDKDSLEGLLAEYRLNGGHERCDVNFFEAKMARTLNEKDRMDSALQRIVEGKCQDTYAQSKLILAHSHVWLAESLLQSGNKEEARALLEAFKNIWIAPDSDLELVQLAKQLESRL